MTNVKTTNFTGLFPENQVSATALQRQQELAQALMQQGQTPIDPARSSGKYVVPISPVESMAQLGKTLSGAYMQKQADQKQLQLAKQQKEQMMQLFGAGLSQGGGAGQVAPGASGGQPTGGGSLALPGMSPEQAYLASQLWGDQYGSAYMDKFKPTEATKRERELNITPDLAKAMQIAKMRKEGTIDASPGNTLIGPGGQMMVAPDFKNNVAGSYQNGQPIASPISGSAQAASQLAGATKRAESENTIIPNVTVNGREGVPTWGTGQPIGMGAPEAGPRPEQSNGPNDQGMEPGQTNVMPSPKPVFGQTPIEKTVIPGAQSEVNQDFITHSYRPVLDTGVAAKRNLATLQTLDNLDISGSTGWGTEAKAKAANVLTGLGIAPKEAEEYAGNAQVFNSMLQQQTWTLLGQQKGPQTEGDAQRAQETFAQLGNTPQSNEFIKDLAKATANLQIKQAQFYQQNYPEAQQSGDLTRLESAWSERAPSVWDDPALKKWEKNNTPSVAPGNAKVIRFDASGRRIQ